jgi:hypothetical protein
MDRALIPAGGFSKARWERDMAGSLGFERLRFAFFALCLQLLTRAAAPGLAAPQDGHATVLLLVDGTSGTYAEAVATVVKRLKSELDGRVSLQIAQFDAEPARKNRRDPRNFGVDDMPLAPRTPLRDAILLCLEALESAPPRNEAVLVVVAGDESYSSWISDERIAEVVQRCEIVVHAIQLPPDKPKRPVLDMGLRIADGFVQGPIATRARTSRLLARLADASGGTFSSSADPARVASFICQNLL